MMGRMRFHQVSLLIILLGWSWSVMTICHELGHVVQGHAGGREELEEGQRAEHGAHVVGAVDRADQSAISTALREAEEEIGLDFSQVSPMGFLDRLDTISDYRVLPVVGLIDPSFVWQANEHEVSEVFTVPMRLAVDYDQYTHHRYEMDGKTGITSSMHWQGHLIWGITASILLNLGSRLGDWTGG